MKYKNSYMEHYTKGDTILKAGEVKDDVFIIREGEARIQRENKAGSPVTVDFIGPGQVFGEMGFILEEPSQ
ncbi:MAG: cyclic nucleotide-binding domain-containing protein, partial [Candidatus Cloacimonetes bacterium]|nr:cyclic nucleotide-binding domain-containing protein [Candidatus Cloacimonadota bacterium]